MFTSAMRKEKEINNIHIGKKEVKLFYLQIKYVSMEKNVKNQEKG